MVEEGANKETASAQAQKQIDAMYNENHWRDAVVDQEILTTPNRDIDFDQFNDENNTYTRFGNIHQQQSQNIINDEADLGVVHNKFSEMAAEGEKEKIAQRKAK